MILGDFNMPSADWDTGTHKEGATADQTKLVSETQELCDKFLLQQIISTATHRRGNTLDLVFTNKPDRLHSQDAKKTALSDHYLVTFNTNQIEKSERVPEKTNEKHPEYGFHMLNLQEKGIDWKNLGKSYKTDWKKLLAGKSDREMKSAFHEHCIGKTYEYAPKRSGPPTRTKKGSPETE